MTRLLTALLSATAVVTVLAGAASAAPVVTAITPAQLQSPAAPSLKQDAYWIRRHGHRVWIPNHHHYR